MAVAVWRHGCRRIEEKGGGSRMVSAGEIKRIKNRVPNEWEGGLKCRSEGRRPHSGLRQEVLLLFGGFAGSAGGALFFSFAGVACFATGAGSEGESCCGEGEGEEASHIRKEW